MDDQALAELIQGAQRGDAAAFDRLVEQFAGRIFGFSLRMTGSRHDAEDLMQEVFVRVVRMLPAYQHDGRFEAWIFRIAGNLVRDRSRRAKRLPKHVAMAAPGSTSDDNSDRPGLLDHAVGQEQPADASLIRLEDIDALDAALKKLPEAEREVILLRHFSRMSFKEIAEVTEVPLGTALARAHRGLGRLREMMSKQHRGSDEPRRATTPRRNRV